MFLLPSGGQFISAVVGCTVRNIFSRGGTQPVVSWAAAPVGVGVALLLMQLTRTVHPPGKHRAVLAQRTTACPECGFHCMASLRSAC